MAHHIIFESNKNLTFLINTPSNKCNYWVQQKVITERGAKIQERKDDPRISARLAEALVNAGVADLLEGAGGRNFDMGSVAVTPEDWRRIKESKCNLKHRFA